jgi:hypothetical protein
VSATVNPFEVLLIALVAADPGVIPPHQPLRLTPACVCALRWIDRHPTEAKYALSLIECDVVLAVSNPDAKPMCEFERLLIERLARPDDVVELTRRAAKLSAATLRAWPAPQVLELLTDKPSNRPEAA